jgi:hypothetical protein
MQGTGNNSITTNGAVVNFPLYLRGTGSVSLRDDFISINGVNHTGGLFKTNDYLLQIGDFESRFSNVQLGQDPFIAVYYYGFDSNPYDTNSVARKGIDFGKSQINIIRATSNGVYAGLGSGRLYLSPLNNVIKADSCTINIYTTWIDFSTWGYVKYNNVNIKSIYDLTLLPKYYYYYNQIPNTGVGVRNLGNISTDVNSATTNYDKLKNYYQVYNRQGGIMATKINNWRNGVWNQERYPSYNNINIAPDVWQVMIRDAADSRLNYVYNEVLPGTQTLDTTYINTITSKAYNTILSGVHSIKKLSINPTQYSERSYWFNTSDLFLNHTNSIDSLMLNGSPGSRYNIGNGSNLNINKHFEIANGDSTISFPYTNVDYYSGVFQRTNGTSVVGWGGIVKIPSTVNVCAKGIGVVGFKAQGGANLVATNGNYGCNTGW